MKRTITWIIGIGAFLGIAAGSYFWAMGMIDSTYSYRSVLKDSPPEPGAALGEASTARVIFVLIDGLRYDTSLKTDVMPTLGQLRTDGASALMHSRTPSFSEPGYSTLLTGAWPEINDGPVLNLDYEEIPVFTQDNLFSAAHRAGFITAVSGYYWFEKLIPQSDVDLSFYTSGDDQTADREVVDAAKNWLAEDQAQLILIHIDQVDYAGHYEGGAQSPNWDAAARRSDELLSEIVSSMDLEKDTVVVLSDHGHINTGGHGGQDPVVLLEPFVIAGAGIKPGSYPDIQMVDVAPTLAALLGTNLPASTQGRVQTEMVSLSASVLANLAATQEEQQTGLVAAYLKALPMNNHGTEIPAAATASDYQNLIKSQRNERIFSERILRAVPAAILLALAITAIIRLRKKGSLAWIAGGFLTVLLFNFRYAILDQKVYSMSSIISQMDLILYIGITSIGATLISWLVICAFQKTFRLSPNQAGLEILTLGFGMVFILSIPIWLSYVLNGAVVTWTLPDYTTNFLALLALIQILFVSAFTPLLSGLTVLISKILKK